MKRMALFYKGLMFIAPSTGLVHHHPKPFSFVPHAMIQKSWRSPVKATKQRDILRTPSITWPSVKSNKDTFADQMVQNQPQQLSGSEAALLFLKPQVVNTHVNVPSIPAVQPVPMQHSRLVRVGLGCIGVATVMGAVVVKYQKKITNRIKAFRNK